MKLEEAQSSTLLQTKQKPMIFLDSKIEKLMNAYLENALVVLKNIAKEKQVLNENSFQREIIGFLGKKRIIGSNFTGVF